MSRVVLPADADTVAGALADIQHRRAYVEALVATMEALPTPEPERYGDHDAWYLVALQDGLFRRVFVVEYRAWRSRIRDLVRDQLSAQGLDSDLWRPVEEARDAAAFVFQVRLLFAEELECDLGSEVWDGLQELAAVAEAIAESSRAARLELAERHPDYFSDLDVFGDGDPTGRLTLSHDLARRAFGFATAFWSALPYEAVAAAEA
ncbi:hypothetical protein [Algihabitans albus]|uniref:hypothetical protein n=1 Tax=Algihabitans albus TaxID=2164067 RepID=UPI000E5C9667|nr:hypothetical protein [Algihabitans albus]